MFRGGPGLERADDGGHVLVRVAEGDGFVLPLEHRKEDQGSRDIRHNGDDLQQRAEIPNFAAWLTTIWSASGRGLSDCCS